MIAFQIHICCCVVFGVWRGGGGVGSGRTIAGGVLFVMPLHVLLVLFDSDASCIAA